MDDGRRVGDRKRRGGGAGRATPTVVSAEAARPRSRQRLSDGGEGGGFLSEDTDQGDQQQQQQQEAEESLESSPSPTRRRRASQLARRQEMEEEMDEQLTPRRAGSRNTHAEDSEADDFGGRVEFAIPSRDDDLMVDQPGQYVVLSLLEEDAVKDALFAYEEAILSNDWKSLTTHFDAFYSMMKSGTTIPVSWEWRVRLVAALVQGLEQMKSDLEVVVLHGATGSSSTQYRNMCVECSNFLLMSVYLLHKLALAIETEVCDRMRRKATEKKKPRGRPGAAGKKGKAAAEAGVGLSDIDEEAPIGEAGGIGGGGADDDDLDWAAHRRQILEKFTEIAAMQVTDKTDRPYEGAIRYLWRGGEVNKPMIKCMLETAFKFLEHGDVTRNTNRAYLLSIFQLIRAICNSFAFFTYVGGALFEKLMNLDYFRETSTSYPFIDAIHMVADSNDMDRLIIAMLLYFSKASFVITPQNSKAICLFMTSVAEKEPKRVLYHLQPFVTLLSEENASIRLAALNVLATLLESDALDPKIANLSARLHNARKRMIEKLQQHVRDVNAYVRAGAIKCFTSLMNKRRIPTELFAEAIVSLVGERLTDQKVAVRKEAIKCMNSFLLNNPFGHDFSRADNQKKLKQLLKQRETLEEGNKEFAQVSEAEALFDTCVEMLHKSLVETLLAVANDEFLCLTPDQLLEKAKDVRGMLASKFKITTNQSSDGDETVWGFLEIFNSAVLVSVATAADMLVCAALNGDLPECAVNKNIVEEETPSAVAEKLIACGRNIFLQYAAHINAENQRSSMRVKRRDEKTEMAITAINKDIRMLVDKLIVEKEFAACLPLVFASVMHGEGGDYKQGIEFINKCCEFGITGAEPYTRRLCSLVWKPADEGRSFLMGYAPTMFLSSHSDVGGRIAGTTTKLINLVNKMSEGERVSVEEVLALTAKDHPFEDGVYTCLWEVLNNTKCTHNHLAALKVLSLLSRSDQPRMRAWLRRFQKIIETKNAEMSAEALQLIANLASPPRSDKDFSLAYRIPWTDSLFVAIERFMLAEMMRPESTSWMRALKGTLAVYFDICKDTCAVVTRFVARAMWFARRLSECVCFYKTQLEIHEEDTPQGDAVLERLVYLETQLAALAERMCMLTGELAVRFLVHADLVYVREFLRIRQLTLSENAPRPIDIEHQLKDWEAKSAGRKGVFDFVDADEGNISGLNEEERIRNRASTITNVRLMRSHRLLGRLLPLVVYCARARGMPELTRQAAVTALGKLMILNKQVSDRGARIFFSFLVNSPSPILRSNLSVCAADLTFRHPNLVEKHATSLFEQLRDKDSVVRETCMLVLTHLIGNDLLKTHGVLSYALTGYVDPEPSIQHLTKNLFQEWSKKDGVLSHVPDFISRLSRSSKEVPLAAFRTIMTNFLSLLRERKDSTNMQSLVEKLCKRFETAKNPRVISRHPDLPAYYSHCLSMLHLNIRSFHKLVDCLDCYKQFLADERVYEDLFRLLTPFAKEDRGHNSEITHDVNDFLKKLEKLHNAGRVAQEVEEKVAQYQKSELTRRGGRRPTAADVRGTPHSVARRGGRPQHDRVAPSTATRPRRVVPARRVIVSESEEDDEEGASVNKDER